MYGFNWFEDENSNVFGALTLATHFLFYWVHGLIVLFVLPKDKIKMYKIQKGKEPDQALINKALLHVGLGHAVAVPVGTYFLTLYMVQDMSFDPAEFEIKSCAFYIVLWHILFDTWFYWTHRAAHHPSIYRFIHKQHHEFYVPVSICAGYAHPLEDLVVNLGSTLIGRFCFLPMCTLGRFITLCACTKLWTLIVGTIFPGALGITQVGCTAGRVATIGTIRNRGGTTVGFSFGTGCAELTRGTRDTLQSKRN